MTFAATMTSDLLQLLGTDHFGEQGSYWPKCGAGSERRITVIVDEQDIVHEKNGRSILEIARINLFAKKHATTGIDLPMLGDRYIRDSDKPPATGTELRQYFLSKVMDVDADGGWYEFVSRRTIETGGNVSQQESFAG